MNIEREKAEKLGLSLSMVSGGYIVHCPSGNRRIDSLIEVHAFLEGYRTAKEERNEHI
jgi:hypothetical protein